MKKPPDPPRPFFQCLPPCPLQKPPLVLRLPLSCCFVSLLLSSPVTRKLHGPFLVPPGSPVFCSSSPVAILDLGCCPGTVGRLVCVVIRSSSGTTNSALFRRINGGLHLAPWLIDVTVLLLEDAASFLLRSTLCPLWICLPTLFFPPCTDAKFRTYVCRFSRLWCCLSWRRHQNTTIRDEPNTMNQGSLLFFFILPYLSSTYPPSFMGLVLWLFPAKLLGTSMSCFLVHYPAPSIFSADACCHTHVAYDGKMRHRGLNNTTRCCLKFAQMEYSTGCIVLLNWCRFISFVLSRDPLQFKDCVYFKYSVILTKFCGQMCRIAKPRKTIQLKIIIVFPPIEQPSYKLQSIALDLDAFHGLQVMSCCAVGLLSTSVFVEHHLHFSSFWWVLVYWFLGIQDVQLLMGYCGAGLECWYSRSRLIKYVGWMAYFFKYKDLNFMAVHFPYLTPHNYDPSQLYWFSLDTYFVKFCAARGKWVESASGRAVWTSVGPSVGEPPWLIAPVCSSHFPHGSSLILSSTETIFLIFLLSVDSAMLWFLSSGADLLYSLLGSIKQYTVRQKTDLTVHSGLIDNYRCTKQFFGFALVDILLICCVPVGFMLGWFSTVWSLCWAVFCSVWPSNMRMGLCLTMSMPWIWLNVCNVYIWAMWTRIWGELCCCSSGNTNGCVPSCVPHRSVAPCWGAQPWKWTPRLSYEKAELCWREEHSPQIVSGRRSILQIAFVLMRNCQLFYWMEDLNIFLCCRIFCITGLVSMIWLLLCLASEGRRGCISFRNSKALFQTAFGLRLHLWWLRFNCLVFSTEPSPYKIFLR